MLRPYAESVWSRAAGWLPAVLLALGIAAGHPAVSAETAGPGRAATAESIGRWISQLDSDLFIERERATGALIELGRPAIGPLAVAADSDTLEVATRAVRILLELGHAEDRETARMALDRLAQLQHRPAERDVAEAILGQMREAEALSAISQLGGTHRRGYAGDGRVVVSQLLIGHRWRGGDTGLKHVHNVRALQTLSIHGAPITDAAVAELNRLRGLVRIELFGTKLTQQGVGQLRQSLPDVEIDYRGGALLGVHGIGAAKGAHITYVKPDSAAAKAGLVAQDVITTLDGRPVQDFRALARFVAEHRPGDRATLELLRGGQRQTVEVTFGAWQ